MAHFRPMLRTHNLTEQQWRVIRVLANVEQMDTGELAEQTFLLGPSLTRMVQTLERDGLVNRQTDPKDLRRTLLSLSSAGRTRYEAVSPDSEALYEEIESAFGHAKLSQLYKLLSELNDALNLTEQEETRAYARSK